MYHFACEKYLTIESPEDVQLKRLRDRGLSEDKINKLLGCQLTSYEKQQKIYYDGHDSIFHYLLRYDSEEEHIKFLKGYLRSCIFKHELI